MSKWIRQSVQNYRNATTGFSRLCAFNYMVGCRITKKGNVVPIERITTPLFSPYIMRSATFLERLI